MLLRYTRKSARSRCFRARFHGEVGTGTGTGTGSGVGTGTRSRSKSKTIDSLNRAKLARRTCSTAVALLDLGSEQQVDAEVGLEVEEATVEIEEARNDGENVYKRKRRGGRSIATPTTTLLYTATAGRTMLSSVRGLSSSASSTSSASSASSASGASPSSSSGMSPPSLLGLPKWEELQHPSSDNSHNKNSKDNKDGTYDAEKHNTQENDLHNDTSGDLGGSDDLDSGDKHKRPDAGDAVTPKLAAATGKGIEVGDVIQQRYKLGEMIGRGRFGIVRCASDLKSGKQVAIKIVNRNQFRRVTKNEASVLVLVSNQARMLRMEKESGLTLPLEVFHDEEWQYIVMDKLDGGELFDRIIRDGRVNELDSKVIFRTLARCLGLIHSCGVVHRDVKPENVLFMSADESDLRVELTDFGFAWKTSGPDPFEGGPIPGTFGYASPEILRRQRVGQEADIWSLGVVLYVMLSGELPFPASQDGSTTLQMHTDACFAGPAFQGRRWEGISQDAVELIAAMLAFRPLNRPTAIDILRHPWLFSLQHN